MAGRRRLDAEMVRRQLVSSRSQASELITARKVTVSGALASKPARLVDAGEPIEILDDGPRFVSRGGLKLDGALDRFGVSVDGCRVIDVGSSTGGFTDCALVRGAAQVVAIDVGRNQLHERLRGDSRVAVHEQTNVRTLDPADVGGPGDVVVADLSFISLRLVADALLALAAPDASLVLLIKPQFEAGKQEADRGRGVIRDAEVWRRVLIEVANALSDAGAAIMGVMVSPIVGGDGNVEFFIHGQRSAPATPAEALPGLVAAAVEEAESR